MAITKEEYEKLLKEAQEKNKANSTLHRQQGQNLFQELQKNQNVLEGVAHGAKTGVNQVRSGIESAGIGAAHTVTDFLGMDEKASELEVALRNSAKAQAERQAKINSQYDTNFGGLAKVASDTTAGVIGMAPTVAAFVLTPQGKAAAAGKGLQWGSKALGFAALAAQSAGGGINQALLEGADVGEAKKYGALSAVKEVATELPFAGIGKVPALINVGQKLAGGNALARGAVNMATEGAEEAVAEYLDPYIQRATYNPNAENASIEDMLYSALIGGLVTGGINGGMAGVGKVANMALGGRKSLPTAQNQGESLENAENGVGQATNGLPTNSITNAVNARQELNIEDIETQKRLELEQKRLLEQKNKLIAQKAQMEQAEREQLEQEIRNLEQSIEALGGTKSKAFDNALFTAMDEYTTPQQKTLPTASQQNAKAQSKEESVLNVLNKIKAGELITEEEKQMAIDAQNSEMQMWETYHWNVSDYHGGRNYENAMKEYGYTKNQIPSGKGLDKLIETYQGKVPKKKQAASKQYGEEFDIPMAERDLNNVTDRNVKAYQQMHPEVRETFREQAEIMLQELNDTIDGGRVYGIDPETRTVNTVRSQTRHTSSTIEKLRKAGMTNQQIRDGLERIIRDHGAENTINAKRVETVLDDSLANGYQSMWGRIPKNFDYAYRNKTTGELQTAYDELNTDEAFENADNVEELVSELEYLDSKLKESRKRDEEANARKLEERQLIEAYSELLPNMSVYETMSVEELHNEMSKLENASQYAPDEIAGEMMNRHRYLDLLLEGRVDEFVENEGIQEGKTALQKQLEEKRLKLKLPRASDEIKSVQKQIDDIEAKQAGISIFSKANYDADGNIDLETSIVNVPETARMEYVDYDINKLSKEVRNFYDMVTEAGKKYGFNVRVVDGIENNANGMYDGDRTILLNGNMMVDGKAIRKVFAHEVYHYLKNTDEHKQIIDLAIEEGKKRGLTKEQMIVEKYAEYARNNVYMVLEDGRIDRDYALDEIGASFIQEIMSDPAVAERMWNTNPTIAEKIVRFIEDVINQLRGSSKNDSTTKKAIAAYEQGLRNMKRQNAMKDSGKRYSLPDVEPIYPSSNRWSRSLTTAEVKAKHPTLFDLEAEESEKANPTQVATTVSTYRKIYNILKDEGFNGKILDASSGRGNGTKAGIEEYGFDVDDIEPFHDKDYIPKYTDYSTLDEKYDVIISNAVLNVLPQELRDSMVVTMDKLLNDGGKMFINVRGDDVKNAKSAVAINEDALEYFIAKDGSYQKGFTQDEFEAYLGDVLGDGYTIKSAKSKFGKISVIATKNGGSNKRYSFPSDKEYMDAVNNNDMESAQKMVDKAAVKAGARHAPNGRPLYFYHGTDADFTVFDENAPTKHGKSLGAGYYLTALEKIADRYDGGRKIKAYVMTSDYAKGGDSNITSDQVKQFIKEMENLGHEWYNGDIFDSFSDNVDYADKLAEMYGDWADVSVLADLRERFAEYNNEETSYDFSDKAHEIFGYNGLLSSGELVLWDNRLIKSADPVTYDDNGNVMPLSKRFNVQNPDIRYSIPKLPNQKYLSESDENLQAFMQGSQVVNEDGSPKVVYSGHGNTNLFGSSFDKKKATAGGFYFTVNPNIASNYAKDKMGVKEYYENGDEYRIKNEKGQYKLKLQDVRLTDEQVAVFDDWLMEHYGWTYEDFVKDQARFDSNYRRLSYTGGKRNLQNIHWLMEQWGDTLSFSYTKDGATQVTSHFEELLKDMGIEWDSYTKPSGGVFPVYLSIRNPIDTSKPFPADVMKRLERIASREKRVSHEEIDYTHWTSDYPVYKWIEDIKRMEETGKETYWATQVPAKARKIMQEMGYDGIKDTGGKMGGEEHEVWIAFEPTQVKSAIGNRGTFDPTKKDMRYSIPNDEDYFTAVEHGEIAKAQEMVDDAAEAAGFVVRGHHGTVSDFTVFDRDKANASGDWGKGFYFTTSEDDVDANYATEEGGDLLFKIERLAEDMWYNSNEYGDMPYEDVYEIAKNELITSEPHTIHAALRMRNPVEIGGENETFFDYDSGYDYESDSYYDYPSGLLADFVEAVKDELWERDIDADRFELGQILDGVDDGLHATRLEREARDALVYVSDFDYYNEHLDAGEIIRGAFERMGFDGIIDRNVSKKFGRKMDGVYGDTAHYIVFSPSQIKDTTAVTYDDYGDIIPLSERFNGRNNDIRYSFEEDVETYGALPKGENPNGTNRDIDIPAQTSPDNRVSRWTRTAAEAEQIDDTTVSMIETEMAEGKFVYEPTANKKQIDRANRMIGQSGWESQLAAFRGKYDSGARMTADDIVLGERLIQEAQSHGDYKTAVDLIADIAALGSEMGQSVQALSVLKRLTPQGKVQSLKRVEQRINATLAEQGKDSVKIPDELLEQMLQAESHKTQSDIWDECIKAMADQVPATFADKVNAWRYLAMLSNPKTHIRNFVGNSVMRSVSSMKRGIQSSLENRLLTAEEERLTTLNRNVPEEYVEFARWAWESEGRERAEASGGRYNDKISTIEREKRIFETEFLEKWRKGNENALFGADMLFKESTFVHALARYMYANNLQPSALQDKASLATYEKGVDYALLEADKATFQEASKMAQLLSQIEQSSPLAQIGMGAVFPFKKTPINILKRGVEYSPVGLLNGLYKMGHDVQTGKITKAEAIDAISAGLTGSAIMALGCFMASLGMIVGGGDEDDNRKQWYDQSMGSQNYALKLPNGATATIDWMAPAVMPLMAGAELYRQITAENPDNENSTSVTVMLESMMKVANPVLEMSMLQGLTDTLKSYNQGTAGMLSDLGTSMVSSYGGQFIPAPVGALARTIDDTVRSSYAPKNSAITKEGEKFLRQQANKLPIASSMFNEASLDVWGNPREREGGNFVGRAFNNFINPATYSSNKKTELDYKLDELYKATGNSSVYPKSGATYINATETTPKVQLNHREYARYGTVQGQNSFKYVNAFANSYEYNQMDDNTKAEIISDLYSLAEYQAKKEVLNSRGYNYVNDSYEKVLRSQMEPQNYYIVKQQMDTIADNVGTGQKAEQISYLDNLRLSGVITNEQFWYLRRSMIGSFNKSEMATCPYEWIKQL